MKPTKMTLNQGNAETAVLIAKLLEVKLSKVVADNYLVYTLEPETEHPQIEEMILLHYNKENHSGYLMNSKGDILEFENNCYIYDSLEEAEAVQSLIILYNHMVNVKKLIEENILEVENIIKEIDELLDMTHDFFDILILETLRDIMCNEKENLFTFANQANEIKRATKKLYNEQYKKFF